MEDLSTKERTGQYLKNHKKLIIFLIILLAGGGFYIYKSRATAAPTVKYVTQAVSKGSITSNVSGTGQVAASNQVDIKPLTSGSITTIKVSQGQPVKTGTVVATIDSQSALNQVNSAWASLAQSQANYDKVMAGATTNDVEAAQLSVKSAQQALDKAKSDYDNAVTSQQQAVDKAYSTLLNSGLEADPSDTQTTAQVTVSGNYTGNTQGAYTISLYGGGDGTHYLANGLGNGSGVINRGLSLPIGNGLYITFDTTGSLYTGTSWTIQVPNTKGSGYLNNLKAYNAALQSQKQALASAQQSISTAQNQLDQENLTLQTKTQPPLATDIASAKAQLQSAEVNLANAQTSYSNTILKAPFDGVIAKVSSQVGDQANVSTAVATEITQQQLAEITLNEVDAAKVKVGQKATLTFSALSNFSLTGTVASVDAIGTVSQNVVNFTVKIALDTQNDQIKPGMSVSASIITNIVQDVLKVPSAAVKTGNGQSYVEVLVNGQPQQVPVTTGISSDTETEISGDNIKEGDEVVTQTISSSAAKSATQSSGNLLQSLGGNRAGGAVRSGGNQVFIGGAGR